MVIQDIIPLVPWERSLRAAGIKCGPVRISKIRWESIPWMGLVQFQLILMDTFSNEMQSQSKGGNFVFSEGSMETLGIFERR